MGRSVIVLLLGFFLAASVFAITNAGSADAQQNQSSQTGSVASNAYTMGEYIGTALGVRDGAAIGGQHDIAGLPFNTESYIAPSRAEVCAVYEDFYAEETYVCSNSQHYIDFFNGYMSTHDSGYHYGYMAGYYLSATLGSLYQPAGQ
jgi:hypothetical protein